MKIIISLITTLLLLLFVFMIIYLFPDKKNIEKFSNKKIPEYSNTIEEPINDSLIPNNPYAKIILNEYEIIEVFKYILKRNPTVPEINKFMYYSINELKEFLYNSPEYEKLIKIQDNIYNNGMEAAIAKKNLINRIMELYKTVYKNDIPVKMILPLRDCFIYLQLNIYLFMTMLENNNYSAFEDSVLSSYILTKKILLELFNKYFNVLELKIYAEEKINNLSATNDINDDKYLISKIQIANIIKDLILINNDYLLIKIKSNYPSVFNEILKNTIGVDKLSINNNDIISLKKYLNDLFNSTSKIIENNPPIPPIPQNPTIPSILPTVPPNPTIPPNPTNPPNPPNPPVPPNFFNFQIPIINSTNPPNPSINNVPFIIPGFRENYQNFNGGYNNNSISEKDYYEEYKKIHNMNKNDEKYYDDLFSYGYYYYLRYESDYPHKMMFNYYDRFKINKDNMNINDINYYNDLFTVEFSDYLKKNNYNFNDNANNANKVYMNDLNNNVRKSANTDLPFRNNYMNDLVYDEDNSSVLRLYNPIVHNKSYLLPSGYRPPVCTSLGQEQLTQPVFTESKLLFQGLDINKAFTETQVGSIMPKFIYNEFKDIKIK